MDSTSRGRLIQRKPPSGKDHHPQTWIHFAPFKKILLTGAIKKKVFSFLEIKIKSLEITLVLMSRNS